MAGHEISAGNRRRLVRAAALDLVSVLAGAGLFLATGKAIWLVAGMLLGAGFLIPALIPILRTRRS